MNALASDLYTALNALNAALCLDGGVISMINIRYHAKSSDPAFIEYTAPDATAHEKMAKEAAAERLSAPINATWKAMSALLAQIDAYHQIDNRLSLSFLMSGKAMMGSFDIGSGANFKINAPRTVDYKNYADAETIETMMRDLSLFSSPHGLGQGNDWTATARASTFLKDITINASHRGEMAAFAFFFLERGVPHFKFFEAIEHTPKINRALLQKEAEAYLKDKENEFFQKP